MAERPAHCPAKRAVKGCYVLSQLRGLPEVLLPPLLSSLTLIRGLLEVLLAVITGMKGQARRTPEEAEGWLWAL